MAIVIFIGVFILMAFLIILFVTLILFDSAPYFLNVLDDIEEWKKKRKQRRKMIEYIGEIPKVIKQGEKLDIALPKPIATVKFDAYSVGTYIVEVDANGNWTSKYCFGPTEEEGE